MNDNLLKQLNRILETIQGNYQVFQIKEIKDYIISNEGIISTIDNEGKRVIFIFGKYKILKSIVRQDKQNRFFKYDNKGIALKNCYNVYLKSYKSRCYTINL